MSNEIFSNWRKQFIANYEGTSPEAKSLEPFLKTTYKGDVYIPWAVMERLTYMQDPSAEFRIVRTECGKIVHTDSDVIKTFSRSVDKDGERITETSVDVKSHFVVLELTFLGKKFTEVYPIQDNSYDAPKVINQNMVNKALQRGKARLASRATGLAFKLYEGEDLQFEDDASSIKTKPVSKENTNKQTTTTVVQTETEENTNNALVKNHAELLEIAKYIKSTPELAKGIKETNAAVFAKYKFTLSQDDSLEELVSKLSKLADPNVFLRGLKQRSGIPL
mgnify:FL=1